MALNDVVGVVLVLGGAATLALLPRYVRWGLRGRLSDSELGWNARDANRRSRALYAGLFVFNGVLSLACVLGGLGLLISGGR